MTDMPEPTETVPDAPQADGQPAEPSAETGDQVACVEAILFSSDSPLTPGRLAQATGLKGAGDVKRAVNALNARYDASGAAFTIEDIAGGYQMMTRPEYNDVLSRMRHARADSRLSQAALETLAIVAYRQPILRADVEAIRGVACGEILRGLMDRQLVKIVGRAEVIGRPMLYGTTKRFLEVFGLKNLDDLPRVEELRQPIQSSKPDEPEQDDQDEQVDQDDQDEQVEQIDEADQDEQIDEVEQTEQVDGVDEVDQGEQIDEVEQLEQIDGADEVDQGDETDEVDQGDQMDEVDQGDQTRIR